MMMELVEDIMLYVTTSTTRRWTRIFYTVDSDSEDETGWYLHFQYQSRCTIRDT